MQPPRPRAPVRHESAPPDAPLAPLAPPVTAPAHDRAPLPPPAPSPRDARPRPAPRQQTTSQLWQRAMFYSHLWVGVLLTALLLVLAITGVLLNHKRGLGLMPDVEHAPTAPFESALSLATLVERATAATPLTGDDAVVDRMDVRPDKGYVKVRFSDPAITEVTVDLASGTALHVGARGDVFMEQLHSGELFGKNWIILSDIGAVGLTLLLISGYWLWLAPRWRRR